MFKPKTLLKVVSIIFIITGVIGLIGTVIGYMMLPQMEALEGIDMSLIEEAYTPLNLVLSVISTICCVLAGFFGFTGKSSKWATIFAGIYTLVLIISVVQTFLSGLFTPLVAIDFIIPILYWWGLYQSK